MHGQGRGAPVRDAAGGLVGSALICGALLAHFSQLRLIQVVQGAAVVTLLVNVFALWKQEPRDPSRTRADLARPRSPRPGPPTCAAPHARRRLLATGSARPPSACRTSCSSPTAARSMKLTVSQTTALTAAHGGGGIAGLMLAARRLNPARIRTGWAARRDRRHRGLLGGDIRRSPVVRTALCARRHLIGFGAGLFGHGTLTGTMAAARDSGESGLAPRGLGRGAGHGGRPRHRGGRRAARRHRGAGASGALGESWPTRRCPTRSSTTSKSWSSSSPWWRWDRSSAGGAMPPNTSLPVSVSPGSRLNAGEAPC